MHTAIWLMAGFERSDEAKRTNGGEGSGNDALHNSSGKRRSARGRGSWGSGSWDKRKGSSPEGPRRSESQLAAIRKLMRRALVRGAWLTLNEIAKATESERLRFRRSCGICAKRSTGDTASRSAAGGHCVCATLWRAGDAAMRNGRRSFGSIACCGRGRLAYGKSGGRGAREASEMKRGRRRCHDA